MKTLAGWEISWSYSTKYIDGLCKSQRVTTLEDLPTFIRMLLHEDENAPDPDSITIKPILWEGE